MHRRLYPFGWKNLAKIVVGQSADTDTVVASAKAYVNALNKLLNRREKTAPV